MITPTHCSYPNPRATAFSLVEVLSVLAVFSLLAAALIPTLGGMQRGSDVSHATRKVTDFFNHARQYATANNTYVYVSLLQTADASGRHELWVAASCSNDGTDISDQGRLDIKVGGGIGEANLPSAVLKLKGFVLKNKAEVPISAVPRPQPASDISTAITPAVRIGEQDFPISFWFAPDGTANLVSEPLPTRLELGLQPATNSESKSSSVIQVAGLAASVHVYRPE